MRGISTESLAGACARRPWLTIGIWVFVLAAAAVITVVLLGGSLTTDYEFTGRPESKIAEDKLGERLRGPRKIQEVVVARSSEQTVESEEFRSFVGSLSASIAELDRGIIESSFDYYSTGDPDLVSRDRHSTIIPVTMAGTKDEADRNIGRLLEVTGSHDGTAGFDVFVTGEASIGKDFETVASQDLLVGETVGAVAAMIILLIVFGTIVAASIPLLLAVVSITVAMGIAALTGQIYKLAFFVENMITMMGLAVGIDYSLFIVSRYREERRRGLASARSIEVAGATASRAVLFSGMTVVLALSGMLLVPSSVFQSLGLGAIFVVLVAIMAALTLLPAILALLGDRIERLRVPLAGRARARGLRPGGFWDLTAALVMRRPLMSLVLAGGLLVAMAIPFFQMETGSSGVSTLSDELPSKQGYNILTRDFSFGLVSPIEIVIDGDIGSPAVQASILELTERLKGDPAFAGEPALTVNEAGDLALISVRLAADPYEAAGIQAIRDLRGVYIPQSFAGADAQVDVGGEGAINVDLISLTDRYRPIVFAFVLGLSFVLLTVVFRSLVVPLKAIIMNLVSVGASYGLIVLVFQKGYGAGVLGFTQVDSIETWLPLFLFSILFGLSMDYHVFLLSRIRERYIQTGDNEGSVAFGLRYTGGIITGAALIMVAVFSGFAAGDLVMFQQLGFGLAVAVLLDATIVRSVLVPAAMRLLGDTNWYLPGFLYWLPDFHVEGALMEGRGKSGKDSGS